MEQKTTTDKERNPAATSDNQWPVPSKLSAPLLGSKYSAIALLDEWSQMRLGGSTKQTCLAALQVIHSFLIWNQFKRAFNLPELWLAAPIRKAHLFTPSVRHRALTAGWSQWEITALLPLQSRLKGFRYF